MVSENRCHECDRLWGEYVSAVFQHTSLERLIYFTRLEQGPASLPALKQATDAMAIERDSLREQIRLHELKHRVADAATA